MKIHRAWSMPSRHTFSMVPIAELLLRYQVGKGWTDPFCGESKFAEFRNDLAIGKDARDYLQSLASIGNLLLDPPYSPRQIAECYRGIGKKVSATDTQHAGLIAQVKDLASERMLQGSLAICCGWNSSGMGSSRGFNKIEILLVNHGASHNDTIVTVERKRG